MRCVILRKIVIDNNTREFTLVSLFSGAGGLDLGFERQGFKTIWANDIDKDACATHRLWSNADVIHDNIEKIDFDLIPNSDVIAGGFPCQGFSLAGPRKIDDNRNVLYKYFVKLVKLKQPYIFVAENVKGILTMGNGDILKAILKDFNDKGYDVFPTLINAADYGVPQDRWRVIMIGFRKDLGIKNYEFPEPLINKVSLLDSLKGLPEPLNDDICEAPFSSRFMSRNRKRDWNQVSYTIPAMAKQVPLHPSSPDMENLEKDLWRFGKNGDTRRFSWREASIIQTFPKEMEFVGSLTSKYKQIGNAVPVRVAEIVANQLYGILSDSLNMFNYQKVGD